ncbi:MAG: hypothetical protein AAGM22_05225 [Acidobacteriota bacterium]
MEILVVGLLMVVVVELGVLIYLVGGGGGLPWMVRAEEGNLSGKVADPSHHRTLGAKVEFLMCAARYQVELEQQRFRMAQGLKADGGEVDFTAAPGDVKG